MEASAVAEELDAKHVIPTLAADRLPAHARAAARRRGVSSHRVHGFGVSEFARVTDSA